MYEKLRLGLLNSNVTHNILDSEECLKGEPTMKMIICDDDKRFIRELEEQIERLEKLIHPKYTILTLSYELETL